MSRRIARWVVLSGMNRWSMLGGPSAYCPGNAGNRVWTVRSSATGQLPRLPAAWA
ncbi:hypothetical protein ACFU7Y_31755 [Kitasatospora sp. NPDC057542]|uniref:hypothetical protein n=1 Tax=Streptomycetaceae TaxID=2062 RepID=UPI001CCACF13|nr:hypothetical protein [Streptomyces sp. LS1784]